VTLFPSSPPPPLLTSRRRRRRTPLHQQPPTLSLPQSPLASSPGPFPSCSSALAPERVGKGAPLLRVRFSRRHVMGAPLVELLFAVVTASVVLVVADGVSVQECINKVPSPSCHTPPRPPQICSALFFFASPPLQMLPRLPLSVPRVEAVYVNRWLFRCVSSLNALTPLGMVLDFAVRRLFRRVAFPWVVPCSSIERVGLLRQPSACPARPCCISLLPHLAFAAFRR
jgi:hypothetical protein